MQAIWALISIPSHLINDIVPVSLPLFLHPQFFTSVILLILKKKKKTLLFVTSTTYFFPQLASNFLKKVSIFAVSNFLLNPFQQDFASTPPSLTNFTNDSALQNPIVNSQSPSFLIDLPHLTPLIILSLYNTFLTWPPEHNYVCVFFLLLH